MNSEKREELANQIRDLILSTEGHLVIDVQIGILKEIHPGHVYPRIKPNGKTITIKIDGGARDEEIHRSPAFEWEPEFEPGKPDPEDP